MIPRKLYNLTKDRMRVLASLENLKEPKVKDEDTNDSVDDVGDNPVFDTNASYLTENKIKDEHNLRCR